MRADRQEFDHRRLIERDAVGGDDVGFRHADIVGHAAVDMHAEHAEALAAIGLAAPAGDACPAGKIGDDRDALARPQSAAGADLVDFAGQFVADDARIFEIGLRAVENMQVGAADAGAAQADARFARAGVSGFGRSTMRSSPGLAQSNALIAAARRRSRRREARSTKSSACAFRSVDSAATFPTPRICACLLWIKRKHQTQVKMFFMGKKRCVKTDRTGASRRDALLSRNSR